MHQKLSDTELDALEKKMANPDMPVRCPRCGNEMLFRANGNSCEAKRQTEGCIKERIRGLYSIPGAVRS